MLEELTERKYKCECTRFTSTVPYRGRYTQLETICRKLQVNYRYISDRQQMMQTIYLLQLAFIMEATKTQMTNLPTLDFDYRSDIIGEVFRPSEEARWQEFMWNVRDGELPDLYALQI